ncbi:MAG: hypothetical protein K2Q97_17865 [Burkholderiaceae bacterium]|nr:hypothetical protein [Burkholderiaceae bacterium]
MAGVAALVSACKSPVEPGSAPDKTLSKAPGNGGTDSAISTKAKSAPMLSPASAASTAKAYRKDAATHLYGVNSARIFKGPLPAHLYAIGVLEVDIDRSGQVQRLHWMRAPRHAPEVVVEIERTVRAAAPYPVPARLGKVTYTDTWLWDKSGHFQLDTLTEGQL